MLTEDMTYFWYGCEALPDFSLCLDVKAENDVTLAEYTGEGAGTDGGGESDSPVVQVSAARSRTKRRATTAMPQAAENNNNSSSVKNERLSPTSTAQPDNNSSSSRSATPSSGHYPDTSPGQRSSYPDTPPAQSPGSSPGLMNRNYSDMMRSLAAKYNNTNPNEYFSGARNGSNFPLDSRFGSFKAGATPFVGLMAPLATTTIPTSQGKTTSNCAPKDTETNLTKSQQALYASIANPFNASNALFPPLIDMSSTQALLNMVRTASAHNATQLETYLKGAIKRPAPSESSPLDLSSASLPQTKKSRKSLSENSFDSFLNIPIVDSLRTSKGLKRTGSVSPSRAGSTASSPRLANATLTSSSSSQPLIGGRCMSLCRDAQSIAHWTTDDVCSYVTSIEACAEYAQNFRAERIDGSSLPLLTEDHLTNAMGMKLGPALKLKVALSRRLGNCVVCSHCLHCHSSAEQQPGTSQAATTDN